MLFGIARSFVEILERFYGYLATFDVFRFDPSELSTMMIMMMVMTFVAARWAVAMANVLRMHYIYI